MRALLFCNIICLLAAVGCSLGQSRPVSTSAPVRGVEARATSSPVTLNDRPQIESAQSSQAPAVTRTLFPLIATQLAKATARASGASDGLDATPTVLSQHIVKAGDTLTRLAAAHGVAVSALVAANNLANPDLLDIGQVIQLPAPPQSTTPLINTLPDARLIRSAGALDFDVSAFVTSQPGALRQLSDVVINRQADGSPIDIVLTASQVIDRVSIEFSVDPRILLAFLEHLAGLLSEADIENARQLLSPAVDEAAYSPERSGLYDYVSKLADDLNLGYYGWKYRNRRILEFEQGARLAYHPGLGAGSVGLQYALAQRRSQAQWRDDIGEAGLIATYQRYFGAPDPDADPVIPPDLRQPELDLPFPRGQVWRFTGGAHGGWGNGSAWAAIDFAPPAEELPQAFCYKSSFPVTAVAAGSLARLGQGVVALDLDGDGDEGTGWTILYLHLEPAADLALGQDVAAGRVLGYTSCRGGYSTATHLHIARKYMGEWLPADCVLCAGSANAPPFVLSDWQVLGLAHQPYQGYLFHRRDRRSVLAEQGRASPINEISW